MLPYKYFSEIICCYFHQITKIKLDIITFLSIHSKFICC